MFYNHNGVVIRQALLSDVGEIADHLRESDRLEVAASHGHTGPRAIAFSYARSSICLTVAYHQKPVAMFGLVPDARLERVGSIWFLATDDLKKMWVSFLKLTRPSIDELLAVRPILYNYVDARNATAIRWLQWAGAKLSEPRPYGILQLKFHFFTIEKKPAGVLAGNARV